jgi:phenylalanyl-tRNA synthetase beta chain
VRWEPLVEENAFLHPTISARLMDHDLCVGQVGLIHPVLAEQQGWPQAFLIQIDETCWDPAAPAVYKPFSRFQKVQRDFSLYCPASVKAENILSVFRKNVQYLESLRVFDYYAAENSLPTLGMSAIFQAFDKTLEDKDLVPMIQKALDALKEDLGVTLKNE